MAQFFNNRTVVNRILSVGKPWNFTKKDFIIDLTLLVKYIKACPDIINNDIKILVAYQLWKMFLSSVINSEVVETAAQNCYLKKELSKILKNLQENTSTGVSFFKNKTKREKRRL